MLKREVKKEEFLKKKTVYCLVNKNKSQEVVICILTWQNLKQFSIAYAAHGAPATSLRKGFSIDPRFRIPQRFHACIRQGLRWPVPEVSRLGDGFAIRCTSTVCLGWNLGYTYSGWSEVFCLTFPVWLFYFPKLYVRFLGNSSISPWKVYLYQFTGTTTLLICSENTARVWFAELITITLRANKSLGKRQIMLFFGFCAFLIYS